MRFSGSRHCNIALLLAFTTLSCLLMVTSAAESRSRKKHFLSPHWLGRSPSHQGRSDEADSGRGLMAKLMMFKSMFQQQQQQGNNVIIITQPTTTTTITTTPETSRSAQDNERLFTRDGYGEDDDDANDVAKIIKNDIEYDDSDETPVILGSNGVDSKILLDVSNENVVKRSNKRRKKNHRATAGIKNVNNKRKKKRMIIKKNRNKKLSGNSEPISGTNMQQAVDMNSNSRIQNIMNAFRRQTPVIYNH